MRSPRELHVQREGARRAVRLGSDPFDVALQYSIDVDDQIASHARERAG